MTIDHECYKCTDYLQEFNYAYCQLCGTSMEKEIEQLKAENKKLREKLYPWEDIPVPPKKIKTLKDLEGEDEGR